MEERNGWQRALLAAKNFDVTVLYCNAKGSNVRFSDFIPTAISPDSFHIHEIKGDWLTRGLQNREFTFYFGYRRWQRLAFNHAHRLHLQTPFSLSHTVTLCGYREPGFLGELGVPHVWGPIGGTHNFDFRYRSCLDLRSLIREYSRSVINNYQLRHSLRVSNAIRNSRVIVAATRATHDDLLANRGISPPIDLETGIDYPILPVRVPRPSNTPLRLLWTGRLRAWKGLPLLLKALSQLPSSVQYELRVQGNGSCQKRWQKLAKSLRIDDRITWLPWTEYRETLENYSWADAFVFTSLRDTSGTGLVEALAAGTPIIGLNHQGAADLMTEQSAIPIPVGGEVESIGYIQAAIEKLWNSPDHWHALSLASTELAQKFAWVNRQQTADTLYADALSRPV